MKKLIFIIFGALISGCSSPPVLAPACPADSAYNACVNRCAKSASHIKNPLFETCPIDCRSHLLPLEDKRAACPFL